MTPAPILLIGPTGQLGRELQRALSTLGTVVGMTRADLDLMDAARVRQVVRAAKPSLVVNSAAYTRVEDAEGDEASCRQVNTDAPRAMAEAAREAGAPFFHFSTDYVFNGEAGQPYRESDAPDPLNVYGRTKRDGEDAVLSAGGAAFVFRLSWVYGLHQKSFLSTVRALASTRDELRIVSDQVGHPTWVGSVAAAVGQLAALLRRGSFDEAAQTAGLYHMSGAGEPTSWAGFAAEILRRFPVEGRAHVKVVGIPSSEYPTRARRPAFSAMSSTRLRERFGIHLPEWREQLRLCLLHRST